MPIEMFPFTFSEVKIHMWYLFNENVTHFGYSGQAMKFSAGNYG
jgi:hypothetical protein